MMSINSSHIVPADPDTVWQWHTKHGAVARLLPPFYPLTPRKQATNLATGSTVLSLPAGLRWEGRHDLSGYIRGKKFTDVCISAPIRALANWRHVHYFSPTTVDGQLATRITDEIQTRVPKSTLVPLLSYRQHQLIHDLAAANRFRQISTKPIRIAVTGSRGMVGRALCAQLSTLGYEVVQLVRDNVKEGQRYWNPFDPNPELLSNIDVVVHLAGEPFFGRFNDAHKTALRTTRIEPTRKLAQLVALSSTCHTMISASSTGYYGVHRNQDSLSETAPNGEGFLAELSRDWEFSCQPARDGNKRVVSLRCGVIMSGRGGLLPVLKNLFSTGLGGRFADAEAWFSWIALDDLTDIIITAALDPSISGAVNTVSPYPVTNAEMATTLGKELHRPARFPIPALGSKMILGSQGAEELALADQKISPKVLLSKKHHFRYSHIQEVFRHELGTEQLWAATKPELDESAAFGD